MRKKILLLSGYACQPWIWDGIVEELGSQHEINVVTWPHERIGDFHQIRDFAEWVAEKYLNDGQRYDLVIGHSMGGLVALYLGEMMSHQINHIVIVESFILSPSEYFKNLVYKDIEGKLTKKVVSMFDSEKPYYSELLLPSLTDLDLTQLAISIRCKLSAIYGVRGKHDYLKVAEELKWDKEIKDLVNLKIVEKSSHFPMLENPEHMKRVLIELLE